MCSSQFIHGNCNGECQTHGDLHVSTRCERLCQYRRDLYHTSWPKQLCVDSTRRAEHRLYHHFWQRGHYQQHGDPEMAHCGQQNRDRQLYQYQRLCGSQCYQFHGYHHQQYLANGQSTCKFHLRRFYHHGKHMDTCRSRYLSCLVAGCGRCSNYNSRWWLGKSVE